MSDLKPSFSSEITSRELTTEIPTPREEKKKFNLGTIRSIFSDIVAEIFDFDGDEITNI